MARLRRDYIQRLELRRFSESTLGEFPHSAFPFSILASLGAGIGEEIILKLFLLSFWAFILGLTQK
jgi:hypothetical protein